MNDLDEVQQQSRNPHIILESHMLDVVAEVEEQPP